MSFRQIVLLLGLNACYTPYVPDSGDTDSAAGPGDSSVDGPECAEGNRTCFGATWSECMDGEWAPLEACSGETPACDGDLGCVECEPGQNSCEGNSVRECTDQGTVGGILTTCEAPSTCNRGECVDPCDPQALQYSYLGCKFLAVSTANTQLNASFDNDFAVVIGNPANGHPATVNVVRNGNPITTLEIPSGSTAAIQLGMVPELKNATSSTTVLKGAYEISSNVPVAAYQYNPLNYTTGGQFSFTNDASLLLPEHTLTESYRISTWPTFGTGTWTGFFGVTGSWSFWYPGFVAIAAVEDGTTVTFTTTGRTGQGSPTPMQIGASTTISLNRADVAQILGETPNGGSDPNFCTNNGGRYTGEGDCPNPGFAQECEGYCSYTPADFTGSTVTSNKPIAVWAGHVCTFMPYHDWACDHLEEMMFPTETWGGQVLMTAAVHPSGSGVARSLYRVLAHANGTEVSFNPAVAATQTIDAGKFIEFETDQDFEVQATKPIFVTQALLGQDSLGAQVGDPALGSGIPWRQYRDFYDFLTPATYTANYVNVVANQNAAITLDGNAVSGFTPIAGTNYAVARVALQPGSHQLRATDGSTFGITTYGYAMYTSYLYPGGLNFKR